MDNQLRDMVFDIGKILPQAPEKIAAYFADSFSWHPKDRDMLVEQIQMHKVVLSAYHNIDLLYQKQATKNAEWLLNTLQNEYEQRTRFATQIIPSIQKEIIDILEAAGVPFLFIKGSSLKHYPHGYTRQMNDLDLLVPCWDDCFSAMKALQDKGYSHSELLESPWIARIAEENAFHEQMVGHFILARHQEEVFVGIDLHTAPFLSALTGTLESAIWERSRLTSKHDHVAMVEDQLLILIAHAVNHGYFLIKDFNDIYALLTQQKDHLDWDYFSHYIQKSVLTSAAYYAFDLVHRTYNSKLIPPAVLAQWQSNTSQFYVKVLNHASRKGLEQPRKAERNISVLHTLAYEKNKHTLASGLKISGFYLKEALRTSLLQNERLSHIPLWNHIQNLLRSKSFQLFPLPRRGEQIFLVPILDICDSITATQLSHCCQTKPTDLHRVLAEGEQKHALRTHLVGETVLFLRLDTAECIYTAIDIFIPTRDGIFPERKIALLENLFHMIAQACDTLTQPGVPLAHIIEKTEERR